MNSFTTAKTGHRRCFLKVLMLGIHRSEHIEKPEVVPVNSLRRKPESGARQCTAVQRFSVQGYESALERGLIYIFAAWQTSSMHVSYPSVPVSRDICQFLTSSRCLPVW